MAIIFNGVSMMGRTKLGPLNFAPTYAITPSAISINEGDVVTFNVTTTNVPNGTTLYWSTSGTATSVDFVGGAMSGSFTITGGAGTITRTLSNDLMTEGPENMYINVRTDSVVGTVVAASSMVVIGDTSMTLTDPVFNYVSLLLNGNGTNGAQNNTFVDSSTNALAVTRNGNTTQGTFTPFSQNGWSSDFTINSAITIPANTAFNYGSGDFTIEFWLNCNSHPANVYIVGQGNVADVAPVLVGMSSGRLSVGVATSGGAFAFGANTGITVPLKTWVHCALVRSGNKWSLFYNGIEYVAHANYSGVPYTATEPLKIGAAGGSSAYAYKLDGEISNLRIVKGTAVYTTNFTPSTTPLTAISGTQLLTLQDNRFIDNSTNNFAMTVLGSPKIVASSPFVSAAPYSTSVNGGSMYFDGTGDYLALPVTSALDLGTNACCVESWVYLTSTASMGLFCTQTGGSGQTRPNFTVSSTSFQIDYFGSVFFSGSITIPLNTWNHVSFTRASTSGAWRFFLNGKLAGYNASGGQNLLQTTVPQRIGMYAGTASAGYLSNLRIVNGSVPADYVTSNTAVGTVIFTPPTAPLTAITDTQLLLNNISAGIYDSTGKLNVETVGTAKISTTQSKFGGSSMYFDGSALSYAKLPTGSINFGASNFTIEFWYYKNDNNLGQLFQTADSGYTAINLHDAGTSISCYMSSNGSTWNIATPMSCGSATLNAWNHFALCRNGSVFTAYLNGVQTATTTNSATMWYASSEVPVIGGRSGGVTLNGYIDDFRITNGVARYTAAFTPPVLEFPVQ